MGTCNISFCGENQTINIYVDIYVGTLLIWGYCILWAETVFGHVRTAKTQPAHPRRLIRAFTVR